MNSTVRRLDAAEIARRPAAHGTNGALNGRVSKVSKKDRDRLILEFQPVIKSIARGIANRLPPHIISAEDLEDAGVIGLIDAIEKYDPSRDNTFKTYAKFRIRGAMLDELRKLDWVPRSIRQKESALGRAYEKLVNRFGRPGTNEEVAGLLGIGVAKLEGWLTEVWGVSLLSLETLGTRKTDGEVPNLLEILPQKEFADPRAAAEVRQLQERISVAVEDLPYQEKVVIVLYYYEELTMKEIGNVLKVSESRVSHIHTKAIPRLRKKLAFLMNGKMPYAACEHKKEREQKREIAIAVQIPHERNSRTQLKSVKVDASVIRAAIQRGEVKPTQTAVRKRFQIGHVAAGKILQALEDEGVLSRVSSKTGSRAVLKPM